MFYTDRLMIRSFDQDTDLNLMTQWLNDVEIMSAISLHPPGVCSKADTKKFMDKVAQKDNKLPFFVICEDPTPGSDPASLGKHEDLFSKDGTARYPFFGILNMGSPDDMHFATRIVRWGIAFDREHQDRGYGSELLNWAAEYCFKTLGAHKVELDVSAANVRALHVYEKIGFKKEGLRKKRFWINGHWEDLVEMGYLEEDWFAKHQ